MSLRIGLSGASSNANEALRKLRAPLRPAGRRGWSGLVMVFCASMTSKCRSTADFAVRAIASSMPQNSTGAATTAAVAKKATRDPMESWSVEASRMPTTRPAPSASSGRSVTTRLKVARCLALAISVWRSSSACSLKFSSASRLRPKAFRTRMPCTDSSTVVARSPAWSWLRRATLLNRVRKRNP